MPVPKRNQLCWRLNASTGRLQTGPEFWYSPKIALCQSAAWLAFLEESQKGEIIIAVLREDNVVLGYFAGLLIAKCGLSILGSQYMGFVLEPELPRADALDVLQRFGFRDLHRTLKPTGDSYVEQDQS
jgi:hypothetical protein